MAEIADGIRIVEPAQEHFESYQKACEKMRAYLSDETINDPVGKRESKYLPWIVSGLAVKKNLPPRS